MALRFSGCFEQLLETVTLIGDSMPRFHDYMNIFKGSSRMQRALSSIFVDILNFCLLSIDFFKQKSKPLLLSSSSDFFDLHSHLHRFQNLLEADVV